MVLVSKIPPPHYHYSNSTALATHAYGIGHHLKSLRKDQISGFQKANCPLEDNLLLLTHESDVLCK